MKTFRLIPALGALWTLLLPVPGLSQEDPPKEIQQRIFVCSITDTLDSHSGSYSKEFNAKTEARPEIIRIPSVDNPEESWFSEDSQYYHYVKETRNDGNLTYVLFGTFDLRSESLSVAYIYFSSGKDGIRRSYATTVHWVCSDLKRLQ